jgi:hypothetical protein
LTWQAVGVSAAMKATRKLSVRQRQTHARADRAVVDAGSRPGACLALGDASGRHATSDAFDFSARQDRAPGCGRVIAAGLQDRIAGDHAGILIGERPAARERDEQSDAKDSEPRRLRKPRCFEHDGIYDHGMSQQQERMRSMLSFLTSRRSSASSAFSARVTMPAASCGSFAAGSNCWTHLLSAESVQIEILGYLLDCPISEPRQPDRFRLELKTEFLRFLRAMNNSWRIVAPFRGLSTEPGDPQARAWGRV